METKKYGQYINGQYKRSSKKQQALFIGRAVQELTKSIGDHAEELKLRLDTLRFLINELPVDNAPDWVIITVAYECGSETPYTEEDRKADEERARQREEARRKAEEETGLAAMAAMEREQAGKIYPFTTIPADPIQ